MFRSRWNNYKDNSRKFDRGEDCMQRYLESAFFLCETPIYYPSGKHNLIQLKISEVFNSFLFRVTNYFSVCKYQIDPFVCNALFLHPLKVSSATLRFYVFRVEKGCIGNKWLNFLNDFYTKLFLHDISCLTKRCLVHAWCTVRLYTQYVQP